MFQFSIQKVFHCSIQKVRRHTQFDVIDSGSFWFSNTPNEPSVHWGNQVPRLCTWARFRDKASDQTFYTYNVHLDHYSEVSRDKSVRLIISRIQQREHQDPFVLTGDFNAGEQYPAITYLKGELTKEDNPIPLVDTFRICYPESNEVGTFNDFTGRTKGEKLDYVFVSKSTRVLNAAIIRANKDGRYPSDHFPVTAHIQFKSE